MKLHVSPWITLLLATLLTVNSISAASALDPAFNIGTGANGIVEQVLPLSDGKILICGNFTSFNGENKSYIARLNSDGSVDPAFTGQASYWVRNMSVQPDGKIVIGGFFSNVGPAPRSLIARLNADGSNDPSFNPGSGCTVSLGTAIDGNPDPFVIWTAIQPDGKILATGNFRNFNGASSTGIVRINPDGSRDPTFNVGGGLDSWGRHIRLQDDGQIVLSGWFQNYNGWGCNRLIRLNPNGSVDTSFRPYFGDRTAIYCTVDVGDGKMIASGHSLNTQGLFSREIERLNPDGTVDESFVGFTNEKTESLAVQPDGKIIVGGYFTYASGQPRSMLCRLNPDGSLDESFQADLNNYVWSVALQSDGNLVISGGFYAVDGQPRSGIARLLTGVNSPPPPPAPSLTTTADSSTQISLTWSDPATNRTDYILERKLGANGTYASIATLDASARDYVDSSLNPGTQYFYRLQANTDGSEPALSNVSAATTQPATGGSASAVFVGTDRTTQGTWTGVYGSKGYHVFQSGASDPSGVTITPLGKSDWIWQYSTSDTSAPLKSGSTQDRIAACWYASSFSVDLDVASGLQQQVSLYFLDWDLAGRVIEVQLVDGDTGSILDSQTVTAFGDGVYLTWDLQGHVKVNLTSAAGPNAVLSGIFFGGPEQNPPMAVAPPTFFPDPGEYASPQSVTIQSATGGAQIRYTLDGSEPDENSALYSIPLTVSSSVTIKAKAFKSGLTASASATASYTIDEAPANSQFRFVGRDFETKGNWRDVYGSEGYSVLGSSAANPSYATLSPSYESSWVWNYPTADIRALQTLQRSDRVAGCWYAPASFTVSIDVNDTNTHRLAIYLCDWDFASRAQTIDLLDAATGAILNSQAVADFSEGQYLIWELKGSVKLRVTRQAGPNAVLNGLFFDPAASSL